jgi:dolichyldiphosphatase
MVPRVKAETYDYRHLSPHVQADRPAAEMYGKGYGMPSSHAQFVAFFSLSLSLFLLLRHVPTPSTSYSPSSFVERLLVSLAACLCAAAVAASRVYLNYHTPKQVLAGVAAGISFAVAWFVFTTCLRRWGWIDWALETWLSRKLRMRDLITAEDLIDAGWGRWESRRKATSKKSR